MTTHLRAQAAFSMRTREAQQHPYPSACRENKHSAENTNGRIAALLFNVNPDYSRIERKGKLACPPEIFMTYCLIYSKPVTRWAQLAIGVVAQRVQP